MGNKYHIFSLVCAVCFQFTRPIDAGSRILQTPYIHIHVESGKPSQSPFFVSSYKTPIQRDDSARQYMMSSNQDDTEYYDDEDDSDDEDESGGKEEKQPEKKKTKFEEIHDVADILTNKWLDGFLQIQTEQPPDNPKLILDIWGLPPTFK